MVGTKAEPRLRALQKQDNELHICPNCGSKRTNQVTFNTYYCLQCDIEFDKDNKMFMIQWDGTLVDYQENEFAELV